MRILWLTLVLAGCAARPSIGDRFDSIDQQLSGLRQQLHVQEQMIAELKAQLAPRPVR